MLTILCLALCLGCVGAPYDPPDPDDDPVDDPIDVPTVTVPQFSLVQIGMTYSQVVAIMGAPDDTSTFTIEGATYVSATWCRLSSYTYDWIYYYVADFENGICTSKYSG